MKVLLFLLVLGIVTFASAGKHRGRRGPTQHHGGVQTSPNKGFNELYNRHRDTCLCHNQKCLCCVKVPGLNYRACVNYINLPNERKLKVDVVFEGFNVVSTKVGLNGKTQACHKLPSKLVGIHYCMIHENRSGKGGAHEACTAFGFKAFPTGYMASLHLKCVTVHGNSLTYSGDKLVGHPGLIDYKRNVHFEGEINRMKAQAARGRRH